MADSSWRSTLIKRNDLVRRLLLVLRLPRWHLHFQSGPLPLVLIRRKGKALLQLRPLLQRNPGSRLLLMFRVRVKILARLRVRGSLWMLLLTRPLLLSHAGLYFQPGLHFSCILLKE